MNRIVPWMSVMLILFLAACSLQMPGGQPSLPTADAATQAPDTILTDVAATLTFLPPAATQPEQSAIIATATATSELPTLPAGDTTATSEAPAPAATETPAMAAPTATVAPTTAPTTAPTATGPAPTATLPAGPTATLVAGDPRSRLGAPSSTDPMNNENTWVWPVGSDQFTNAVFTNGAQVITTLDEKTGWRMANPQGRAFTNIYLEGTFKTGACAGSDHYGLMLRVPVLEVPDQGYLFGVTCDGRFSVRRWNGEILPRGEMRRLVDWTASSAILAGSNQTNRLGVWAVGSRMVFYINGTQVAEVQDAQYASGYFGVFAGYDNTKNMIIQVDEMSYWENPK